MLFQLPARFSWAHFFAEPLYERSRDSELLISCLYSWGMFVRIPAEPELEIDVGLGIIDS